jgi:hypothetical protein
MKRISIVLGLAVLMAATVVLTAGAALAQAAAPETFNEKRFESFPIDNPCPGYEEQIQIEGVFHYQGHLTKVYPDHTQPEYDIYQYQVRNNTTNVTGTGLSTGDRYRFNSQFSLAEVSLSPEMGSQGLYTGTETHQSQIISYGDSPNFVLHITTKYVWTSDLEKIYLIVENVTATCTGSGQTT